MTCTSRKEGKMSKRYSVTVIFPEDVSDIPEGFADTVQDLIYDDILSQGDVDLSFGEIKEKDGVFEFDGKYSTWYRMVKTDYGRSAPPDAEFSSGLESIDTAELEEFIARSLEKKGLTQTEDIEIYAIEYGEDYD